VVFFNPNTLAGEWRAQMRCCEENHVALHRNIAFALAVADVLELPDDLPLMPAVKAALSVPICLNRPGSLARLKAVARSAARGAKDQDLSERIVC
jgi:hypothetical protein